MITCMISGTLSKQPETRQSKNGNAYTLASIRIPIAEGDVYASVTAFSELSPILAGMQRGDPVTVIGQGKVSTYQGKDGTTRAGLSITAGRIIALVDQAAPKPKGNGQGRRPAVAGAGPDPREFADDIPF